MTAPVRATAGLLVGLAVFIASYMPLFAPQTHASTNLACYCVLYLREALGVQIRGNAWDLYPTHSLAYATEGDVLLTREGPGHAALIVGFEGEVDMGTYIAPQFIKVVEANYRKCQAGTRLIPWNSPEIRGVIHTPETITSLQRL